MELIGIPNDALEKKRLAELNDAIGDGFEEEGRTVPLVQSAAFIDKGLAVTRAPSISVPLHS
jgi:hypothetical protein